jgi:hypothetical protein
MASMTLTNQDYERLLLANRHAHATRDTLPGVSEAAVFISGLTETLA